MRKGVTLMELLISVMTITLLSAAFMLSVSEMSATANANRIFSNMKAIKLAAIKWSKDNPEKIVDGGMYINTGSGKEFIQAANKNRE